MTTQSSVLGFLVLFLHDERGVSTTAGAGALAVTQVLGGVARIGAGRNILLCEEFINEWLKASVRNEGA